MTADEKSSVRLCSMALVVVALTGVFLVEQVIQPSYWIKTAIKVAAFSVPVILYSFWSDKGILESINLRKISRPAPLILCMLLFFTGVMLLFFVFHNQLDLVGIKQSLMQKENLTKSNCLFVFSYIVLCNSFLEEAFFRGFVSRLFSSEKTGSLLSTFTKFMILKKTDIKVSADMAGFLLSAVLFSLYHIGIFITWFNVGMFILCVAGLAGVGLFLQWIAEKFHSIAASYVVHASANISINLIGALLIFEIIGN